MIEEPFGVYVHIPFCRSLCGYCGFTRYKMDGPVPPEFIEALCTEISQFRGPDCGQSLFFGGGTPSLLAARDLEKLFKVLHQRFRFSDPEISIEVNPDDVTLEKARVWKGLGINRVSIGIQSFEDAVLRYMGRRHDAAGAHKAIEIISSSFTNWGIDLIYGTPHPQAWQKTLETTLDLMPPHISTYALTYVPNTPIGDNVTARMDDDVVLELYQYGQNALTGYDHYEISNFARDGYYCRHNLLYWRNLQHAGFGPGAYSLVGATRASNPANLEQYLACPGKKAEEMLLSACEEQVETLIQHFRLREGISTEYYLKRFGETIEKNFEQPLRMLINRGLLVRQKDRIRPTQTGYYLNDEIGLALVR
jgi:oxygen-independent coproporphyrinogen III oxidase